MTWTQPVCYERFKQMYPDREPIRTKNMPLGLCCFCFEKTDIYIRIDPATVPFPRGED